MRVLFALPQRLISLTLALLVLAASVGLPVQRRTCRLSGRSTARVAWPVAEKSARTGHDLSGRPDTLENGCYAYTLHLHQLGVPGQVPAPTKLLPAAPGPLAPPPLAYELPQDRTEVSVLPLRAAPLAHPRPPTRPGGRALLVRIGLLVV